MSINLGGITLHVQDVERSLEFYARIPGAELVVHRPGDFALLKIGNGRLGLLKHGAHSFHIELDTNDLDRMYQQLLDAGVKTQGPPSRRPWGERDLLVLDPDGNMLEFGLSEETRPANTQWQQPKA